MIKPRKKLKIGITTGDINGVGPELIIQAFQEPLFRESFTPIIYGSSRVMNIFRKVISVEKFSYNVISDPSQAQAKRISLVECQDNVDQIDIGKPSVEGGIAALQSLQAATAHLKSGELDVMVTMPIDKNTIQGKEFNFPGHTEFLGREFGKDKSLMLMISENLKVATVTGHIPISKVAETLSIDLVLDKIRMLNQSLKMDFNIRKPKIAVLGLNPHAGDNGLLGTEEIEIISKAVAKAEQEHIWAFGPFSADGFFGHANFRNFDAVLSMYHDQGLIPFKYIAGLDGVNFTAGLPVIRTSPDHGVAYDLAGKSIASIDSFVQAVYAGMDIYRNRHENEEILEGALQPRGSHKKPYVEEEDDVIIPDAESVE